MSLFYDTVVPFNFDHNSDEIKYYWNCKTNDSLKNSIDLSSVALYLGIKSFADLSQLGIDMSAYTDMSNQVKTIARSFAPHLDLKTLEINDIVPSWTLLKYALAKFSCLQAFVGYLESNYDFEKIKNFFIKNFNHAILKDLSFPINTTSGQHKVDLQYSLNFRFKSTDGALNLFNLRVEDRHMVIPQNKNDFIYCADFRSFEFRTFLKLSNIDINFEINDLYGFLAKEHNLLSNDVKTRIIAFLYGKEDERLESIFNKTTILNNIQNNMFEWNGMPLIVRRDGNEIHTIVQTISQYIYIEKLTRILKLLNNRKSKFMFPLHDSMIFSINRSEIELIENIRNILNDETYKVKEYAGKDLLNVKELV